MPTYEYRCKACEHGFDVVQAFTDAPLTECPSCGGPLRKVFGNVGITFKGSGFYKTDSRSTNGKKTETTKANGDGGAKTESSSGSEGKKDSSSSTKSESSSASKSATPA